MRRLALATAFLVALAGVAVVLTRTGASDASPARTDAPVSVAPASGLIADGPEERAAGIDGARVAAMNAVAQTDEALTAGFTERRDLIAEFATVEFGPRLAALTSDQLRAFTAELGDRDIDIAGLAVFVQPLTATATSFDGGVRVEVWAVSVLAMPATGPARQSWSTVSLEMVDVDGRWLVDEWVSVPGPTPALPFEVDLDTAETVAARIGEGSG